MTDVPPKSNLFERFVPILVLLSVALAFMVGVLWQKVSSLEKGGTTATTTTAAAGAAAPSATIDIETIKGLWDKDIIKFGDKNSKLLFVEVADPSCPYCHVAGGDDPEIAASVGSQFKYVSDGGTYVPPVTEMKKLVDAGKASFAYLYFPGHANGEMAMKALYCANEKGKFWDAHQLIMSNEGYTLQNTTVKNDKTKSQTVADFLKSVIDPEFMKSCLDSGKYDSRLTEEQNLSATLAVSGTPGFFVNSQRFDGAYSFTDMKSAVDAASK